MAAAGVAAGAAVRKVRGSEDDVTRVGIGVAVDPRVEGALMRGEDLGAAWVVEREARWVGLGERSRRAFGHRRDRSDAMGEDVCLYFGEYGVSGRTSAVPSTLMSTRSL